MENEAFTQYVKKYQASVFRTAYSYVKNFSDAEDIVQDAFLRLYKSDEIFAADENVKMWLLRITVNLSKNFLRSAWKQKCVPLKQDFSFPDKSEFELLEQINSLKPEYRIIIYLFCYEGYSVREISAITGLTEVNIRARLKRGREKLKKILNE